METYLVAIYLSRDQLARACSSYDRKIKRVGSGDGRTDRIADETNYYVMGVGLYHFHGADMI